MSHSIYAEFPLVILGLSDLAFLRPIYADSMGLRRGLPAGL